MPILPKEMYKFDVIPIKIPKSFFTEKEKNLKICMEPQKTPNSQHGLVKKNKAGGITLPHFKLYFEATVIKTVWHWQKNKKQKTRHRDQWNKIENPETNPPIYGRLFLITKKPRMYNRKRESFQ